MLKRFLAGLVFATVLILPVGRINHKGLHWFAPIDAIVSDRVETGWAISSIFLYLSALLALRADELVRLFRVLERRVDEEPKHVRRCITASIMINAVILAVIPTIVHAARVVSLSADTQHEVKTTTSASFYALAVGNVCIAVYNARERLGLFLDPSYRRRRLQWQHKHI